MDKKKMIKTIKIVITVVLGCLFVWFLIIYPMLTFRQNEKTMLDAAKRYLEVNSNEYPTGKRITTLTLKKLYNSAFIKEDIKVPYTSKSCAVSDSWVKVKHENGEYKYYTYLKCGFLSSVIDHKGPEIEINGNKNITIDKGSTYEDAGVKSVIDNKDGKMNINEVIIKNNVNPKKIGTYKVTYTASDTFNNKTVVTRTVKVVERISNLVKNEAGTIYKGVDPNNYIYFSGMLFRIVDVTNSGNVRIIADQDVANVNYDGIKEWLDDYYEKHLTKNARRLLVKEKYCQMGLNGGNIGNTTNCDSYTEARNSYIISATDINKTLDETGDSYLFTNSISWIANKENDEQVYATRKYFFGVDAKYYLFDKEVNNGIRPVLTIKGDTLIKGGKGTLESPYILGEFTRGRAKDLLNTRTSGEFVKYSGSGDLWQIIDVASDGTTKVILNTVLTSPDGMSGNVRINYETDNPVKIYNPTEKGNVGYFIKNKTSEYLDYSYLVNKKQEVPIYKDDILYGKEVSTKKYKSKVFAPNVYEMFSAFDFREDTMASYWYVNSSKKKNTISVMADIGAYYGNEANNYEQFGIRLVGYMDKNTSIVSGEGTRERPYVVVK